MPILTMYQKELHELLEVLGIDPSTARAVDIRIRPDEIVTVTVESYVTDGQGRKLGHVIREHLGVYKRAPDDPIGRNPKMGIVDVTNLRSTAREYAYTWPKWPFRVWFWLKRNLGT